MTSPSELAVHREIVFNIANNVFTIKHKHGEFHEPLNRQPAGGSRERCYIQELWDKKVEYLVKTKHN